MTMMRRLAATVVTTLVMAVTLLAVPAGAAPTDDAEIRVERDVVWRTADGEQLTLDSYLPATKRDGRPAVVLIHGGGWRTGDKASLAQQGEQLAALGYVAVSINYRLAPEHPYPAAVDDVQAAVEWLRDREQVDTYGIDPDRIGALGGSAGAHLTGMLATLGKGSLENGARVRAAVSWSGPMDFTTFGRAGTALTPEQQARVEAKGSVPLFLGCSPFDAACADIAAEASPITHVDETDAPLLLVNSDAELVPVEQAQVMDAALSDADVEHEVVIIPGSRHARALAPDVWDESVAFLAKYLGKPKL